MRHLTFLAFFFVATRASRELTEAGKQAIVDYHNAVRSKIASGTYVANGTLKPAGVNIRKIKWNTTIEATAQAYINKCVFAHSGTPGLGENLWAVGPPSRSSDEYAVSACRSWEGEFQKYGWPVNVLNSSLGPVLHATQMVWAETSQIGCAASWCPENRVNIVCNYYTQGNVYTYNIYETGDCDTPCPTGTTREKSTNLCV